MLAFALFGALGCTRPKEVLGASVSKEPSATPASPQSQAIGPIVTAIAQPPLTGLKANPQSAQISRAIPTPRVSRTPLPTDRGLRIEPCPALLASTLENRVQYANYIVEAKVIERGNPEWNTPTKQRPAELYEDSIYDAEQRIYTPTTFELQQNVKGALPANLMQGRVFRLFRIGGTIGNVSVKICDSRDYVPGDVAILLLFQSGLTKGFLNGLTEIDAYLVTNPEKIQGLIFKDADVGTREELLTRIRSAG